MIEREVRSTWREDEVFIHRIPSGGQDMVCIWRPFKRQRRNPILDIQSVVNFTASINRDFHEYIKPRSQLSPLGIEVGRSCTFWHALSTIEHPINLYKYPLRKLVTWKKNTSNVPSIKDTRNTKWLSERVKSGAPRDLPRRYIRHHKPYLQDKLIQLKRRIKAF